MAEENFSGSSWPPTPGGNPPLSTGEGESPLANPLAPKIDMRTMESDKNSSKESGGAAPRPYVPPPATSEMSQTKETPMPEITNFVPPTFESPGVSEIK